jgi:hypothetical protein
MLLELLLREMAVVWAATSKVLLCMKVIAAAYAFTNAAGRTAQCPVPLVAHNLGCRM